MMKTRNNCYYCIATTKKCQRKQSRNTSHTIYPCHHRGISNGNRRTVGLKSELSRSCYGGAILSNRLLFIILISDYKHLARTNEYHSQHLFGEVAFLTVQQSSARLKNKLLTLQSNRARPIKLCILFCQVWFRPASGHGWVLSVKK